MLSSYRALFGRAGVGPLAVACGLAWLSFAGYTLAIILAVHAATGSLALAGGVVAAFSCCSGVAAPVRGRFIDRHGPAGLVIFTVVHGSWASGLVASCVLRAGALPLLACGALAGVSAPPLIATARSLWGRFAGPDLAPTAHALNAALADAAQLLSPGLVGAFAALLSACVGLGALIAGAATSGVLIARVGRREATAAAVRRPAAHRRTADRRADHRRAAHRRAAHRLWGVLHESAGLRTLVACDLLIGLWTGAFELAATAIAANSGAVALSALPLCTAAAGSIVISLWSGTGGLHRSAAWRYVAGCLLVAAVFPLTLVAPSVAGITIAAVIIGAGYALLNVALFELLDQVVAAERAVEAFTWLTTGNAAGVALGAAAAGQLAHGGEWAALLLSSGSAALAAALAFLRHETLGAPPSDASTPVGSHR